MKFDPSPTAIWRKYERDRDYKRSIGLYDRVRRNEAFYLGRQWEGLRVQSLDPLIFNVLRRCVNLFVSMLVSDDVAVRAQPFDMDGDGRKTARVLERAFASAIERSGVKALEAARAPVKLARDLRRKNAQVGVALRPATPVEPLIDIIGEFDMLLIMTVEPGFGGQSFLETMLPKIRRARSAISEANLEVSIQVDGGVSRETIERCAEAGANVFVAGSAIYKASDAAEEISALRELAGAHPVH